LLTKVAQLYEEPDADAGGLQSCPGGENLFHRRALIHRIQDALTAAFRPEPRLSTGGIPQRLHHALTHQIGACLDRERDRPIVLGDDRRKLAHAVDAESKDVIGKPDVIGCEGALEVFHLLTDGNWAALQVMVSPDRLRAPCTAERAAPGGGQVETEIAVRGQPNAAIT